MLIPSKKRDLIKLAKDVIEVCRSSIIRRQSLYRQQRQWIETGRASGEKSLYNMLYSHTDRLQSYLFSPVDLTFNIDFENFYPEETLLQAEMAARVLTREWERNNIDIMFGEGVKVALDHGACVIKALPRTISDDRVKIDSRLVMPWHFGVYNESITNLSDQDALVERSYMTLPEVWRRISHLPDVEKLYSRIKANAAPNTDPEGTNSFFHQILSTSQLQTSVSATTSPLPGGIVSLTGNNPNFITTDTELGADVVAMDELWLWDDTSGDYVTVQMFEPDILICPLFKKSNLYCPDSLPYGLIQPNTTPTNIWGRSEIVDMTEPQGMLSEWMDDIRRLMGVQYDKLLAFTGQNGISDEIYDQFRSNGYIGLEQGSTVNDLTPKLPEQAFAGIELIKKIIDENAGFSNILSGQGEAGVRAGSHANTLMKTASPRLRDRAILVERQAASFADAVLCGLESKNNKVYWTDPSSSQGQEFLLSQLPDDRRVSVDSHSSSPIYEDDHKELVGFGLKNKMIGPDSALDLLRYPMRDILKTRLKKMQQAEQKLIEQHPELLTKGHKK